MSWLKEKQQSLKSDKSALTKVIQLLLYFKIEDERGKSINGSPLDVYRSLNLQARKFWNRTNFIHPRFWYIFDQYYTLFKTKN